MDMRNVVLGLIYEQLIRVEVARPFLNCIWKAKRDEHRPVEALAGVEIGDAQVNMVEQSTSMELHGVSLVAKPKLDDTPRQEATICNQRQRLSRLSGDHEGDVGIRPDVGLDDVDETR